MDGINRHASDDLLILVDERDQVIGYETKELCHDGEGLLHRAFSILIFNAKNELLVQKRSAGKRLWPLFWSNSVCSHPRKDDDCLDAAQRRLGEELGLNATLKYLFKFQYQARFMDAGSENEVCYVYVGRNNGIVRVNRDEVADWKYMDLEELDRAIATRPELYTPWFKMEWERLRWNHLKDIKSNY